MRNMGAMFSRLCADWRVWTDITSLSGTSENSIAFGMSTWQRIAVSNTHLSDELLMGISL